MRAGPLKDQGKRVALAVLATATITVPATAWATGTFSDVRSDSPFSDAINYIASHGITVGCDTNGDFCPTRPVSRQEMAEFLFRMSGNDPSTPANVNAATVGGRTLAQITGQRLVSGTGAPTNSIGSDGDFYLDTSSHQLFGPKANGAWPGGTSLIGPAGPAGPPGPQGPSGVTYTRTILVSPSAGASATDNGTKLLNAVNSITDASASNPYLVKIEPGVYDLGSGTLNMKPHVDVQGSGWATTTIATDDSRLGQSRVVQAVPGDELRDLTLHLVHVSSGSSGLAYSADRAGGTTYLTRVHIVTDPNNSTGIGSRGIFAYGSNTVVFADDVDVSSPFLTVDENGGGATIVFRNGEVHGPYYGTTRLVFINSLIDGGPSNGSAGVSCINSYDASYTPVSATCS